MTSQSFSVETALDIEKGDPQYAGTLLYLAYGKGQHIKEAVFSLLTAAHFEPFGTGRVRLWSIPIIPRISQPWRG